MGASGAHSLCKAKAITSEPHTQQQQLHLLSKQVSFWHGLWARGQAMRTNLRQKLEKLRAVVRQQPCSVPSSDFMKRPLSKTRNNSAKGQDGVDKEFLHSLGEAGQEAFHRILVSILQQASLPWQLLTNLIS